MPHHPSPTATPQRSALARAAGAVLATTALFVVAPAGAVIVYSGLVSPDPASGNVVGTLNVGTAGIGTLRVDGGSVLQAERVSAGSQITGDGRIVVSGAGSAIVTNYNVVGSFYNMSVGSQGKGSLQVLDGALLSFPTSGRLHVSSGAGSEGDVLVRGNGSRIDAGELGNLRVGFAGYYTQAVAGFNHGQPNGASHGRLTIDQGGAVKASFMDIAFKDLASELLGGETSTGHVLIDGTGSQLQLVRAAAQTGTRTMISLAAYQGSDASLTVRNGALLSLDGSHGPNDFSGVTLGSGNANQASGQTLMQVSGQGSRVELGGGVGFLNVGRGKGSVAELRIDNGGVLTSTSGNGLVYTSVGRDGGTGVVQIDGAGSLLRMTGMDATGAGAFLTIGRSDSAVGHGSVVVSNGGRLAIDTRDQVLTNVTNQPGLFVGRNTDATGALTITGAGSVLSLDGGSGVTPFFGVGRDGGTGTVLISNGGRLDMSSSHRSVINSGTGYLPGEALLLNVGQRNAGTPGTGPSVGTLTVTGAGSMLNMSGSADRLLQVGVGTGGRGNVHIGDGGTIISTAFLLGTGSGANGSLSMIAGTLLLEGDRRGGPQPGGGGLSIGRGGGSGFASLDNGSVITITPSLPGGGLGIGGAVLAPGGTATMVVTGGSVVDVVGVDASVTVGSSAGPTPSVGTLILSGNGSRVPPRAATPM